MNYNWLTKEKLDSILSDLTYHPPVQELPFDCLSKEKIPEGWEEVLVAKLQAELPDGMYSLGDGPIRGFTGKGGKIQFEVALHKELLGYL